MRRGAALLLTLAACTSLRYPPPLAGSEWQVSAINGRATGGGPNYRIAFRNGSAMGQFGCNHFGGEYRQAGDMLTMGPVAATEMACSGPADRFEGEGFAILTQPMRAIWHDRARIQLANGAGSIDLDRP